MSPAPPAPPKEKHKRGIRESAKKFARAEPSSWSTTHQCRALFVCLSSLASLSIILASLAVCAALPGAPVVRQRCPATVTHKLGGREGVGVWWPRGTAGGARDRWSSKPGSAGDTPVGQCLRRSRALHPHQSPTPRNTRAAWICLELSHIPCDWACHRDQRVEGLCLLCQRRPMSLPSSPTPGPRLNSLPPLPIVTQPSTGGSMRVNSGGLAGAPSMEVPSQPRSNSPQIY